MSVMSRPHFEMAGGNCKLVNSLGEETAVDIGEHTLGRGPLLKITDKRVSRTHAVLVVEAGSMKICSKHKNPCYHKPTNSTNFSPILKDEWKELQPNDQISLLPDDLIFTVMYELPAPNNEERQKSPSPLALETATLPVAEDTVPIEPVPMEETRHSNEEERPPQLRASQPSMSTGRKRILPQWLLDCTSSSSSSNSDNISSRKRPKKSASKTTSETGNSTCSSSALSREKKADTGLKEKETTIDKEVDSRDKVASGGSESTAIASTCEDEGDRDQEPAAEAQSSAAKPLPLCPYGKNCYRKNPVHFKEYSHDFNKDDNSDKEEEDDNRPECPYGTDCYRKNPAHRQQFKHNVPHPPSSAVNKPTKRSIRSKKDKRSVLTGNSDDDGETNTYDYNDSFIDDDAAGNSSSSYGGESEDEDWSPGGGGGGGSVDEDIDELMADANTFISNKKMQRPS